MIQELVRTVCIVIGVVTMLCMFSFMAQGENERVAGCVAVLMVCAVFLADNFADDEEPQ